MDQDDDRTVTDPDQAEAVAAQLAEHKARRIRAEENLAAMSRDVALREEALAAAEELAQVGSWSWRIGVDTVAWSAQVHRVFGTDPEGPEPTFAQYVDMVHPDDREESLAVVRAAVAAGGSYEIEHRIIRTDGRVRDVRGRGRAELDPVTGAPALLMGSIQDITDANIASAELQRSRDLFAGVLDAATELSVIGVDPDGLITVFNTGAERMLGYSAAEMIGTSPERLHDPVEISKRAVELGVESGFGVFLTLAARGTPDTRQWTYVTRDGRRLQAMITVTAMRTPDGVITGYIKIGADVTERLRAQAALAESESLFRDTFEFAPNGMMLVGLDADAPGRLLKVNPALGRLTGYSEAELLGMWLADLTHPDHAQLVADRLTALADDAPVIASVERHWRHANGHDLWVQASVSPRRYDGQLYVIAQVEDITARKQAEAKLTQQALHDWLTGLPNRVLLMDRIEHALAASRRSRHLVAVMYLDLDGFKAVNDTAGHAAGDQLLVDVADRLRRTVRPGDTVARLGGDEFVVVCTELHDSAATAIATRIQGALLIPHVFGGHSFVVTASIGISLSAAGSDAEQMLREADDAMYTAKDAGKCGIQLGGDHDPTSAARAARAGRAQRIESELRRALENEELILYGQPIIHLPSGEIIAVEQLLRWNHPVHGLLAPKDFLDVAEASNLMVPIGRRVLQESCRMAALWSKALGILAPAVHVNVSARQLATGTLKADVLAALHRHELPARQLVLELAETQMPTFSDSMRTDLLDMRTGGVSVAIDDLGTGYSSLARITELAVDILKIDLSFVANMAHDPASAAVVRGILAIGQALNLSVVAEGVETGEQARQLAGYGCDTVQGYLYSRPLPEHDLLDHLTRKPPSTTPSDHRTRTGPGPVHPGLRRKPLVSEGS